MMNPADVYRRQAVYTAPLHVQLAQLHQQGAVMTKQIREFVEANDIPNARKHIQHLQDILAFLRSSLDMELEVSQKTDAAYSYYYQILVEWFLHPEDYAKQYDALLAFWESWADTWRKVQSTTQTG